MNIRDARSTLIQNGFVLVLLGVLTGAAVPILRNPRMGLAAHLGGILDGMLLLLVGLLWSELRLSRSLTAATFWLLLYSAYAGWLAQVLAGVCGTSRATPIGGRGYTGAPWQENLVYAVAVSFSAAVIAALILLLVGLRRLPPKE